MKWILGICLGMCWVLAGCAGNSSVPVNATTTAPAVQIQPGEGSILVPPTLSPADKTGIPDSSAIQFTIENRSDWDVCYVYISPPSQDTWGDDWLNTTEWISVSQAHVFRVSPGIYDIRVENCDFLGLQEQYEVDLTSATGWIVQNPTILANDSFQQAGDWKTGGSGANGTISDEAYILNGSQSGELALATDGKNFDNLVLTVEATPLKPEGAAATGYGVMCRAQSNGDGYLFLIRDDGYYAIFRVDQNERVPLVDWKASTDVLAGDKLNVIEVRCDGSDLGLRINGVTEEKISDSRYQSGGIGLAVLPGSTGNDQVRFDNLVAIQP